MDVLALLVGLILVRAVLADAPALLAERILVRAVRVVPALEGVWPVVGQVVALDALQVDAMLDAVRTDT